MLMLALANSVINFRSLSSLANSVGSEESCHEKDLYGCAVFCDAHRYKRDQEVADSRGKDFGGGSWTASRFPQTMVIIYMRRGNTSVKETLN